MLGALFGVVGRVARMPAGGFVQRGIFGAGVGSISGFAASGDNPNQTGESVAKGALLGGLIGSVGFRQGKIFGMNAPVPAISRTMGVTGMKTVGKAASIFGESAMKTAGRWGMFAAENPKTALGIGALAAGGIGGAYIAGNQFSPTMNPTLGMGLGEMDPGYTPEMSQGGAAAMTGGTGQIGTGTVTGLGMGQNARAFRDSTIGLTQGLHRGRHG